MFARLILALLLAAFAVPALANGPCHDTPMPQMTTATAKGMQHGSHDAPRSDEREAVPHVCIGCIPLASIAARGVATPALRDAIPRRIVATPFDPASGTPPALPPPRIRA